MKGRVALHLTNARNVTLKSSYNKYLLIRTNSMIMCVKLGLYDNSIISHLGTIGNVSH